MLTIPAAAKLSLYLQINVVRIRIIFDPDPLSPKTDPYKNETVCYTPTNTTRSTPMLCNRPISTRIQFGLNILSENFNYFFNPFKK